MDVDPVEAPTGAAERRLEGLRRERSGGLGLRWQVLAVLSVVALVTIMLIGLVVLKLNERDLVRQKADSGVAVAAVLAQTIGASLEVDSPLSSPVNRARVAQAATMSASLTGISQVVVVDVDMATIAAVPEEAGQSPDLSPGVEHAMVIGERSPWWTINASPQGRELLVLTPLGDRTGRIVGAVGVRMPLDEVDARIAASQRTMLLYIAVDALALLLVGYFLLTRLIVRPIEAIARATRRLARGDFGSTLSLRPNNEIGLLADDFNAMVRQLQSHRQRLESQVEALRRANEELAEAQRSLIRSEKLATVGRLAAGVAHEIGNPLSAVIGYVELIQDGDLDPETCRDLMARIDNELHRIDGTLRDLLDTSRAELQTQTLLGVQPLLASAIRLVEAQPRFRGIAIDAHLDPDLPAVEATEGRMQQVLVNLLLNAADAMGGQGQIHLRALSAGAEVLIEVEDTGPGISPEALPHLFEPFFTTKGPGEGTGLGLAICQSIVAGFGGRLEVRSPPGQGATFTIALPAAPARP